MAGRVLSVRIIGDAKDLEKALSGASGSTDKAGSKFLSMGKAAALGAGAAGVGALVVGLKSAVDAAKESEKAQARLDQALKGAGISQAKYGAQIEATIQKTSRLAAIDDEDLSDAFAKLVATTGNVEDATEGMALAADIARSRNVSLETATKSVEKAMLGSDAALKKFGVSVPAVSNATEALKAKVELLKEAHDGKLTPALERSVEQWAKQAKAADKAATAQDAIAKAQERFAGGAETYGKTSAAAQERFNVAMENLQETLGAKLLPLLARVATEAAVAVEWLSDNWPRIDAAITAGVNRARPFIDLLVTTVRNMVTVIRGVVDVIAGIFTGDWDRVWSGMKTIVVGYLSQVKAILTLEAGIWKKILAALGQAALDGLEGVLSGLGALVRRLFGLGVAAVREYFGVYRTVALELGGKIVSGVADGMATLAEKVRGIVAAAPGVVRNAIQSFYNVGKELGGAVWNGIRDALANLGAQLLDLVRGPINAVLGKINSLIRRINGALAFTTPALKVAGVTVVPSIAFDAPDISQVPYLAAGGIVRSPTLAMIGEQGPEAVVPLSRAGGMMGGGDLYATLVVELDGAELARATRKYALRDAAATVASSVDPSLGRYGLA